MKTMNKPIKRIISISDLSVFGKCSQTVAMPILGSMGIEVCPVLTAYLSAHTAFENPVITDMTDSLKGCLEHLEALEVASDCVYTGYIYTAAQFPIIENFIGNAKTNGSVIITDPVMADNGKLYFPFDEKTVKEMRKLCLFADYITPNFTEACFLAGYSVLDKVDLNLCEKLILRLNSLGINGKIIITGVPFADGEKKIIAGFNGSAEAIDCEYIEGDYCGTGDVFSSVFAGNIVNGKDYVTAAKAARDFVFEAVKETKSKNSPSRQGVLFEKIISEK